MNKMIICTPEGMREMRESLIAHKKIAAIKALRRTATPDNPEDKSISLRDAKWAVERFQNEVLGDKAAPIHPEARQIFCGPVVMEVLCDFGTGPVTVDVEAMEEVEVLTKRLARPRPGHRVVLAGEILQRGAYRALHPGLEAHSAKR